MIEDNQKMFVVDHWPQERMSPPAYERIAGLNANVLFIVGDRDIASVRAGAEASAARIKKSKVVTIKDADHLLHMEKPAEINKLLVDNRKQLLAASYQAIAMNEAKIENFLAKKVVDNPNELSGARPAGSANANASASPAATTPPVNVNAPANTNSASNATANAQKPAANANAPAKSNAPAKNANAGR